MRHRFASPPLQQAYQHTDSLVQDPPRAGADDATPSASARQAHVLYVEDNPVNVVLMQSILGLRQAMSIEVASSGDEACARALARPPDLMLLDMRLPDCSGIELLQRLRANPRFASTPAVVVSAESFPEQVSQARAAGFDDYWTKPLDVARTLAWLDAWLLPRPDHQ